jgi:hypothetical protein
MYQSHVRYATYERQCCYLSFPYKKHECGVQRRQNHRIFYGAIRNDFIGFHAS